ncbi:conserved hypothetical protein [delta proteobacterium NaphS2]|nr:conserved hypothetical protein [delta proteobacterium NaphS2]
MLPPPGSFEHRIPFDPGLIIIRKKIARRFHPRPCKRCGLVKTGEKRAGLGGMEGFQGSYTSLTPSIRVKEPSILVRVISIRILR